MAIYLEFILLINRNKAKTLASDASGSVAWNQNTIY